ncbi:MAG: cadmium-translocating P-type ATPase [Anaerolineae bacterium]|nr:cadmium-translocating P-type ATPase [Anaerolineae bacterium]
MSESSLTQSAAPASEKTQNANDEQRSFFSQERLEPILVAVTAISLGASLLGERLGAPEALITVANVISYLAGGWFGVQEGIRSLRHGEVNVDLLMVLAAVGAAIVDQWHEGATLLFLFSLSNVLQQYAMDRSRNAIRALMKLRPDKATVRRDGGLVTLPVESLNVGDVVVIRPGERLPIDGQVVDGQTTVDQSTITGESMPVAKERGDDVFASTVNQNGSIDVRVTRRADETTLARIIKMVEDAQGHKAPTQRFLDAFEQRYALIVIAAVALYIVIPPILPGGPAFEDNFYRAMVLMTVASPCALVISTPASVLSAIANAARRGVLFKGGAYLEQMASIRNFAFDKTGTITTGKPAVTDVVACPGNGHVACTPERLLYVAASVESRSEHPLAQAVVNYAKAQGITPSEPERFNAVPGQGVIGYVDGHRMIIGTERLMRNEGLALPDSLRRERDRLEAEGKTILMVYDESLAGAQTVGWLGLLASADQIRPGVAATFKRLREAGAEHIVILTGDNDRVARSVAAQVGADDVLANLLPENKVKAVHDLEARLGPTAMVGDGVNDAPALAAASLGIAMGAAGTDVALETADIVLMADDLDNLGYAMRLSRKARRIVWQNILFSLGVIGVLVIFTLTVGIPLPLGVVGHEGSTLIVVSNGLRLLAFRGGSESRRAAPNVSAAARARPDSRAG